MTNRHTLNQYLAQLFHHESAQFGNHFQPIIKQIIDDASWIFHQIRLYYSNCLFNPKVLRATNFNNGIVSIVANFIW